MCSSERTGVCSLCVRADGRDAEASLSATALVADPSWTVTLYADEFLVSITGSSSGVYRGDTISFTTSRNRTHTVTGSTQSDSSEQFRCDAFATRVLTNRDFIY